jgi:hypothetical protein
VAFRNGRAEEHKQCLAGDDLVGFGVGQTVGSEIVEVADRLNPFWTDGAGRKEVSSYRSGESGVWWSRGVIPFSMW